MGAKRVLSGTRVLIAVDSYEEKQIVGALWKGMRKENGFSNLMQLLLLMEDALGDGLPDDLSDAKRLLAGAGKGAMGRLATFSVTVLFRQSKNWQGIVEWVEDGKEVPFRSVYELILLIDRILSDKLGKTLDRRRREYRS